MTPGEFNLTLKGKSKLCNRGCNTNIAWYEDDLTGEKYFVEMDKNNQAGERHLCPNWNRTPNSEAAISERSAAQEQAQAKAQTQTSRLSYSSKQHVVEIQVLPLADANTLLANEGGEYEPIGSNPVKVINDQFFMVVGKRSLGSG